MINKRGGRDSGVQDDAVVFQARGSENERQKMPK